MSSSTSSPTSPTGSMSGLFRKKSLSRILSEADGLESAHAAAGGLKRALGVWDLTALGVAAIVGAGIFSTVGNAAHDGGPAVVFLFIFTAIACGFSAFCYAEFASEIPVSGSAYTYAYASFGELIAWIIGWDLLMEYAIGNIAVAISWSDYFSSLLAGYGIHVPFWLSTDYVTAYRGHGQVVDLLAHGKSIAMIAADDSLTSIYHAYLSWSEAPRLLGAPLICNLPALLVTVVITWVAYIGIQESKRVSNIMVLIKIAVVLMVIAIGAFYIHPSNWVPFAPHSFSGVLKGVSAVFFAYIGFDAISTTAEECVNPQRDLPRAMIYSLVICTVLYVLVSLVLTGMVSYESLNVGDPLAFVFGPQGAHLPWISAIVAVAAVIALSTVFLVFQIGQPRIWMAMSRDGLLPPIFSAIHPKYKTPWFSTILTGVVVGLPSLFMNMTEVTDLTSIGTLFAFVLVCAGCLVERERSLDTGTTKKFKIPHFNSKYIFPALLMVAVAAVLHWNADGVATFFHPDSWDVMQHRIPLALFGVGMGGLAVACFVRNLSLIPVLGLSSCAYLMTELGITNWIRFGVWLIVGFVVYFGYGRRHSRAAL